jgi:hypothetical protein
MDGTHGRDVSKVGKGRPDGVLSGGEGEVTDEKGSGRGSGELVVEDLLGLVAKGTSLLGGTGKTEVDLDGTSIDLLSSHLERLLGRLGLDELDVTETTALLRLPVGDDTGRDDLSADLELALEPLVVDVPRESSDVDGGHLGGGSVDGLDGSGGVVLLDLLGGGLGVLGSTLLGSRGGIGHLLVLISGGRHERVIQLKVRWGRTESDESSESESAAAAALAAGAAAGVW